LKSITIDLGGTRTKTGIVENGNIIDHSIVESGPGRSFNKTIIGLERQISTLLTKNHLLFTDIEGIGFAFPGLVDVKQNCVISTNEKFDSACNFNFQKWAKEFAGLPLVLENDARAALFGEWKFGAGKGYDNLVMMTLGTGIGGVCLIEGKALYGKHFQAGVLGGHSTVNLNGDMCNCGNIGCVEALASTWKIKKLIRNHPGFHQSLLSKEDKSDFDTLFNCYRQEDKVAKDILEKALKAWAAGVVNMIHAYDPELVILHGGLMKSADIILPFIQEYVNKYAWTPWGNVRVCKSSSEDFAALEGMDFLVSKI